jgi:N-acetylmuramoyl-L-alanine amidase
MGAPPARAAHLQSKSYATTTASVNLRSGPGTNYYVKRTIPSGARVYVYYQASGTHWYKVAYSGTEGYVYGYYLKQGTSGTSSTSSTGQAIASTARSYVGYSYVWGGASPSTGFDCSGLTQYVYGRYGIYLPHSAASQAYMGYAVSRSNLRPGDLLVFQGTNGPGISHVAIYYGNGYMISASNPSLDVEMVRIDNGYWNYHWWGARRLVN